MNESDVNKNIQPILTVKILNPPPECFYSLIFVYSICYTSNLQCPPGVERGAVRRNMSRKLKAGLELRGVNSRVEEKRGKLGIIKQDCGSGYRCFGRIRTSKKGRRHILKKDRILIRFGHPDSKSL